MNMFNKDTTNHHIGNTDVVMDSLEKDFSSMFPKRPDIKDRTIKEITAAVDALEFDDDSMINAIQMSSDQKVARLRHRATMLTERAKQMHDEADTLEGEAADAIHHIKTVSATLKLSEDILRAHAHIEPKRES